MVKKCGNGGVTGSGRGAWVLVEAASETVGCLLEDESGKGSEFGGERGL